ncbi:FAD-dependent oxidoreductase [Blastococcus haudaquaticus]|uniref:Cholesterol oxidase n=1 Tax=Blastococcus haudaquaticus TaxID=1938745 RepID=A0A286H547_9ACTN|nr:GMC family oxidoreductase [Blastococcus haudaquaticus]SOE02439.1 cholesterol oxidase [Blastococcus haudaquaticus]
MPRTEHTDIVVVGSGFGGSTAALRLTEKGYRVTVLEAGRRFADEELPRTSWDLRRYLWAPQLGCYGVQRIHLLPDVLVMAGAGVGGGSLNYANTLYQPPAAFFRDPQWAGITDWQAELAPYYEQASRMLGVTTNPTVTAADQIFREVAEEMGVGHTVVPTPVGIFFGKPGVTVPDPFFGGVGPERTGCTECGSCMTGCQVGGKNTLVKNYLYLAERGGAVVQPMTTVTAVRPRPGGGYEVEVRSTGAWVARRTVRRWTCDQVVLAAGTYGTQRLLHAMRDGGTLPALSPRLGHQTRTNSEAVLAATGRRGGPTDYSRGVAITSSFHLDDHTHVEPVRYGKGSNAIGLLQTVLVDGGGRLPRWLEALGVIARNPAAFVRTLSVRGWSERTLIALVMQTRDNSIVVSGRRGRWGRRLTSRPGPGEPVPTWIPGGHDAVRRIAAKIGGDPGGAFTDLANIPMTAHFLGGCVIGATAADGVVDPYHRVHGYPGLSVVDGSAVSANLGVNPSLTITAQAERATALWPNKGEADVRPAPGEPYRPVAPVPPRSPVVPAHAPGALRLLPLTVVRSREEARDQPA